MADLDLRVRSPTGTPWILSILAVVVAGEIYYELQKDAVANFFGVPFTDGELWPAVIVVGLLAALSLVWLVSLYVSPGRITVTGGRLRREVRSLMRRRVVDAPVGDWSAKVVFFNRADQARRTFKRVELEGPAFAEVLLFSDLRGAERLADSLAALASQLAHYDIELERP